MLIAMLSQGDKTVEPLQVLCVLRHLRVAGSQQSSALGRPKIGCVVVQIADVLGASKESIPQCAGVGSVIAEPPGAEQPENNNDEQDKDRRPGKAEFDR